jgi:type VI secretion system secreted protein VgrG
MAGNLKPITYELVLSQDVGAPWQVARIEVSEALDEPYRAIVDVQSDIIDLDALLGCDALLTFTHGLGKTRAVCGLVSRIDFLGHVDHQILSRFHIGPALELLDQRVNSKIWQHTSVQDIVGELLGDELATYGRELDLGSIERGSKPRDYCVQYRESDFAFVSRLLEEEGISYEFVHDADTKLEIMTLRDANAQYAELESETGSELPIIAHNSSEADVESIQEFAWSRQLTSTGALQRDYDWHTPRHVLSATAQGADDRGRERRVYAHGRRRFIDDDLRTRATDLRARGSHAARKAYGRSNVTGLRPGLRFRVHGHELLEPEQEYIITRVSHRGAEADFAGAGATAEAYANSFECVPFETEIRPATVTPKPREHGSQTAIVVGPESEEIHTDEFGRIQVQFYWEEQPEYAADASCWVRCSQSWAGLGWGAQFIPRIGMEVVVEFLEGNPDRPLVTGCVYNAEYLPPFSLPEHKTQSGWRTESTPGGGGSNELRFEDAAGDEEIYLHGQKDWTIAIENDKDQRVGHDESLDVGNDRGRKVGHDERFEIGNDQSGRVRQHKSLIVGGNQLEAIGLSRTETIGISAMQTVGTAKTVIVGATMNQQIGADLTTSVGQNHTLTISGEASETVAGNKSVASNKLEVRSADDMTLISGKCLNVEVTDRIAITGKEKLQVDAAEQMVFTCGDASITLKKDGTIQIKGKDVTVKGSGNVVIKGQQVAEN